MEGNDCYKFSTIRNYIERTGAAPIRSILDVGANVGQVTSMMADYFPAARIYAFEPVREYFELGCHNTRHLPHVEWFNGAVSMQHRFVDDLRERPRGHTVKLRLLKAIPEGGPGWGGGSMVVAEDHASVTTPSRPRGYERSTEPLIVRELESFCEERDIAEVDVLKMDCEGCEHHVLGCAQGSFLSRVRFIPGEYHGIERFYRVMQRKLFTTHKVNLIGSRELGCFFAERLDRDRDGILQYDKRGMLQARPWLSLEPMDWHLFNEAFVLPQERWCHALP